jgi:hypothetical protein
LRLAAREVDIDGVPIEIPRHPGDPRTAHCNENRASNLPNAAGSPRAAIVLPEEVRGPIGDAVLDRLVELGLAVPLRA